MPADDAVLLHPKAMLTLQNDDFCPHGAAWWKGRQRLWPQTWLEVAGRELEAKTLKSLLAYSGSDAATAVARQAVAAELNQLRGSDPAVAALLARADAFLAAHPAGSAPRGKVRRQALRLAADLQRFNEGGCPR